jgi:Uma2 family endonuclease
MASRNCRAPDISFISKQRLVRLGFTPSTRKFLPGAPDLAVEILSPNNTRAEIDGRLADFFASGTQIAWIVDPDQRSAEVCHGLEQRRWVGPGGCLEGEHLLPRFRYPLADLFADWDWDWNSRGCHSPPALRR